MQNARQTIGENRCHLSPVESVGARLAFGESGWPVPVAPGVLCPLRLHRDMQISGVHTLALTGPPGAFRVWVSASTNGTPLLECG
ncbi:MAG: hypothetical protein FWH21_08560, partial [Kiritimatiellaeota bacterium]|nr:hypothetical protein [Kiritimatiellota bacterium]